MTSSNHIDAAEAIVNEYLDRRLVGANEPPGLREAIVDELDNKFDEIAERMRAQLDQTRSNGSRQLPPAYFADEEYAENVLQTAAAGIRTALAEVGMLAAEPRRLERELAVALSSNAQWALLGEASRVPRPATRPAELAWSLPPVPWLQGESTWPPTDASSMSQTRLLEDAEPPNVTEAPYVGWVQLAIAERHWTPGTRFPQVPERRMNVSAGLELTNTSPPDGSLPFVQASPRSWIEPNHLHARRNLSATELFPRDFGPIVGLVDFEREPGTPSEDRGAGTPPYALAPRPELLDFLQLRRPAGAMRYLLSDDSGPALAMRLWRSFLVHDDGYSPLLPAIEGADLVLRGDCYEQLIEGFANERPKMGCAVTFAERK